MFPEDSENSSNEFNETVIKPEFCDTQLIANPLICLSHSKTSQLALFIALNEGPDTDTFILQMSCAENLATQTKPLDGILS